MNIMSFCKGSVFCYANPYNMGSPWCYDSLRDPIGYLQQGHHHIMLGFSAHEVTELELYIAVWNCNEAHWTHSRKNGRGQGRKRHVPDYRDAPSIRMKKWNACGLYPSIDHHKEEVIDVLHSWLSWPAKIRMPCIQSLTLHKLTLPIEFLVISWITA